MTQTARIRGAGGRGLLIGASAWLALGVTVSLAGGETARTFGLFPSFWQLGLAFLGSSALMYAHPLPWTLAILALAATGAAWLAAPVIPSIYAWSSAASLPLLALIAALTLGSIIAPRLPWNRDRVAPWLAVSAAAIWLIAVWLALSGRGISGDEPHYLLIAKSLIGDGDFDLKNNYDGQDLLAYYGGSLEPRHVSLGVLGQEYSFHGPGVALLTLPAFALGGPLSARLLVALLVAASTGWLWAAIRRVTRSAQAGWVGCAAFVMSAPASVNGTMIYPDGPGAAIASIGLWALVRTESGAPPPQPVFTLVGLAMAALPWLHLRLGLVAACFGIGLLIALWRQKARGHIACFLAVPAISLALLFVSSHTMFDTFDPTAIFRQQAAGSLAAAPTGLLGLLFDQEYGLLPYAPAFALAPLGLLIACRRHPIAGASALVMSAGTLLVSASWVWWGGQSAPARLLVPILPALGLGVAAGWAWSGTAMRSFIGVGLAFSATLTLLTATAGEGAFAINLPDGHGSIFEWLCQSIDISSALPSLFREGATTSSESVAAIFWIASFATAAAALRVLGRQGIAAAATAAVVACSLAAAAVWSWRGVSPWTADRAELALLYAGAQSARPVVMVSPRLRLAPRSELWSGLVIDAPRSQAPAALLHVPMLPAGRYQIEAEPTSAEPLTLELGQNAWPFAHWSSETHPAFTFVTAFPVWAARVIGSGSDDDAVRVRLRPLDVYPNRDARGDLAWRATPYGPLIVYSLDRWSYPEAGGLWLAANRTVTLAVSDRDGRARGARLDFEAGEAAVSVALTDDSDWKSTIALEPQGRAQLTTPVPADGPPTRLHLTLDGGFLAPDRRGLGVWVSVEPLR